MSRTNASSLSKVVDLFFLAGASRGKDITSQFNSAFRESPELALRLALWARDVRGGAGEREQFRNWLRALVKAGDLRSAAQLALRTPEVGRWDDLLVLLNTPLEAFASEIISAALAEKNGLCAKWMPRKGADAVRLRQLLGMSPKTYRKTLVTLSETVEQLMCAGKWDEIEFRKVPSVAFSRYARAFTKHVPSKFTGFVDKAVKGEEKINASAIFPVDIIRALRHARNNQTAVQASCAQWSQLPNYLEGLNERAIVVADTSGSMTSGPGSIAPIDVCISLALYMSERLDGPFKDSFITFSTKPALQRVTGSLLERIQQLETASWSMSTDLGAAFKLILNTAVRANLPESSMPTKVIIVSDMEFNGATDGRTDFENIRKMYAASGYKMPTVVFWNVNGRAGNSPATVKDSNVALVSGYSPAVAKSVFGLTQIDPASVVLKTLENARYDLPEINAEFFGSV